MDLFQFQYPMEKMPSRNNKCNAFAAFFHQEFSREVNRAFCKKEDFWIIGSFYGRSLLFPKRIFYLSFWLITSVIFLWFSRWLGLW